MVHKRQNPNCLTLSIVSKNWDRVFDFFFFFKLHFGGIFDLHATFSLQEENICASYHLASLGNCHSVYMNHVYSEHCFFMCIMCI